MVKLNITDNTYLILFFSVSIVLSIVFLVLGLTYVMEYNLAIGLFTSFLTTSFTVVFLNIFLNYRKQKQWKSVKDNALFEITLEMATIFSQIIELVEGQFTALTFKMTVGDTKDGNTRKTLIFSKIKEYNDAKPFKLAVNRLDSFTNKVFYEARTNLYSIHVIYGNLIDDARIVNDIINVRNMLRSLELMQETIASFNKMYNENQNLMAMVQKLSPELKQFNINSLAEIALTPSIQKLVEFINDLWALGIQFDKV